jgi:phenylpyruvate tautomerase PptA (4-oxalocrotonate tautomerase family)
MPMWIVHAPEGVYSVEDKKNLTETLTQIYVEFSNLPRFYVVVRFDEYPADSMWLGGEPANDSCALSSITSRAVGSDVLGVRHQYLRRTASAVHHGPWSADGDPRRRDADRSVAGEWFEAACPVHGSRKAMGRRQRPQRLRRGRGRPHVFLADKQHVRNANTKFLRTTREGNEREFATEIGSSTESVRRGRSGEVPGTSSPFARRDCWTPWSPGRAGPFSSQHDRRHHAQAGSYSR